MPLRELFNRPTIIELAAEIESAGARTAGRSRASRMRMTTRCRMRRGGCGSSAGPGRVPRAQHACRAAPRRAGRSATALNVEHDLVRRHESLRTTFAVIDDEPRQRIAHSSDSLTYMDLSGLPSPEDRAREPARADAVAPFDLGSGPLIRIHLLRFNVHVALFNLHHIVCDDRSLDVLVGDFIDFYEGRGAPSSGSERSIQYRDYAVAETAACAKTTPPSVIDATGTRSSRPRDPC